MGMEIEVNSLEDMCALMCDNRLPRKKPKRDEDKQKDQEKKTKPHRP